ncbi:MAG: alpha carbonic anhydrase [Monoraphidium minutum]|nr:MAG: alpha carbonic anhydrase [Monoraphidium minutum]
METGSRHHAHYSYQYNGRDWTTNEEFIGCRGAQQSPINIPDKQALARVPSGECSMFQFGSIAGISSGSLVNNGHTVRLTVPPGHTPSNASVVVIGSLNASNPIISQVMPRPPNATVTRVPVRPVLLHFHTRSEHLIGGREYPLEMHLLSIVPRSAVPGCPEPGCLVATGVMFEMAQEGEGAASITELAKIFDHLEAVEHENQNTTLAASTLDLSKLLPTDHTYIQYAGSLTTPPCTQGVLHHVLTTPVKASPEQARRRAAPRRRGPRSSGELRILRFSAAVGDTLCGAAANARRRRLAGVFDNYLGWTSGGKRPDAAAAQEAPAAAPAPAEGAPAAAPGVIWTAGPEVLSLTRGAVPLPRAAPPPPAAAAQQAPPAAASPPTSPVAAAAAMPMPMPTAQPGDAAAAAAPMPEGSQPEATPIDETDAAAAPPPPPPPAAPAPALAPAPWRAPAGAGEQPWLVGALTRSGDTAPAPAEGGNATEVAPEAPAEEPEELAAEFEFPEMDEEGCRKLTNSGNYRADQPLNGRLVRMWVDAAPCAATLASAVHNSTALARIVGPTGNASTPMSVADYDFAVASGLTAPCVAASGGGRARRGLRGGAWRALAAAAAGAAAGAMAL